MSELREFVGIETLEIEFSVVLFSSQQTLNNSFSAPLRIFFPREEDDDGGVSDLISKLGLGAVEKESLENAYQSVRRYDLDVRSGIAGAFSEVMEIQRIKEKNEFLAELDQAIELETRKTG